MEPLAGQPPQRGAEGPDRPGRRRRDSSQCHPGDPAGRGPARHAVGEAVQVPEPLADEVLGTAGVPGGHRAAAARLRARDDALPRAVRAGALLAGSPDAVQPGLQAHRAAGLQRLAGLDEARLPEDGRRHVSAPEPVFRRLVRRQLGQRRPLWRRNHAGTRPGGREAVPGDQGALRAGSSRAVRPAAGKRWRSSSSTRTSSAARGRTARLGDLH